MTIYQCEDEHGNVTYEAACPPGTAAVNQKRYATPEAPGPAEAGQPAPAQLYVVPNCGTCDQVRDYLKARNVSFQEIDVNNRADLQSELKQRAGELRVPTLIIGASTVIGYKPDDLAAALTSAGYAPPAAEEGTEESPAGQGGEPAGTAGGEESTP